MPVPSLGFDLLFAQFFLLLKNSKSSLALKLGDMHDELLQQKKLNPCDYVFSYSEFFSFVLS